MWNKRLIRAAASVGLALATVGHADAGEDTIRIGMVMPLTGTLAAAGKQVVAGAQLYMLQHGDTVAGKHIALIVKDDGSTLETGKRLIQELVVNDKIDIIGAGLTGNLLASAPLLTEVKIPTVIMLSSTSAAIDKSPFFVRTSCTLAQSAAIVADWATKTGIKKVVTLVSDFAPGIEAEAIFKDRYLAAGGQIPEIIRVPLQNPDFAPFLQRARDAAPQAIFVFVPSAQAGSFAKQFVERGLDKAGITLIGPGDVTDDEALPAMGDAMLGTVTAHFYSAQHPSPFNQAFVAAYRKQYAVRPNFMAVSGYDGMHLIYEALKMNNGSAEGTSLVSAMKHTAWESPRGPMSIDHITGDVIHNVYIRKVEKVGDETFNVENQTFEAVNDMRTAAK